MYTFLSLIGVLVSLAVFGFLPSIIDRQASASPSPEPEPERRATDAGQPAATDERPTYERSDIGDHTDREQQAHAAHPVEGVRERQS
jgi:hypothetical protein